MDTKTLSGLRRTAIALAVLALCGAVRAEDSVAQMISPNTSWLAVGIGAQSGGSRDRSLYDQYRGTRDDNAFGLLDFAYVLRDDGSGTWTVVQGTDLALSTRELSFLREQQGVWKFSAGYNQIERDYPRTVNTGLQGAGTTAPTVVRLPTPGSGADLDLATKRAGSTLAYERWISSSLQFEVNFKNEEKTGSRLWGRGYDCAAYVCGSSNATALNQAAFVKNALLLLPEPINAVTQQIEARFNYHTDALLLSAGYYGSLYMNHNGALTPTVPNLFNNGLGQPFPGYPAVSSAIIPGGGTSLQNVLQTPMALPPDNQAHQFYLDGSYGFSPGVRATFKLSYASARQHDSFAGNGLTGAPAGVNSLDAKVDTTLAQFGLSLRPMSKLSVTANARYEHKDDRTPDYLYNVEPNAVVPATTPATYTYTGAYWYNNHVSSTRYNGKLEASYRLPANWRATAGFDYNSLEREVPESLAVEKVAGLTALRAKNTEHGYRLELRHSMGDTLNGGLSYSNTRRRGSDWTTLSTLDPTIKGTSAANLQLINLYCGGVACYGQELPASSVIGMSATAIFPMSMVDVDRHKWKMSADWNPTERFSLQLVAENGKDTNIEPYSNVVGPKGWRDGALKLTSLDASFAISEAWKLSAYVSHGDQTLHINHSTGYIADLDDVNSAAGITLDGKLSGGWDVGANLGYLNDRNQYSFLASVTTTGALPGVLTAVAPTAANLAQAALGLPDASYRQLGLNLYGHYTVSKHSGWRVNLLHQRLRLSDWQWGYNGVPFVYTDNSTVNMKQEQHTTILGVSYVYHF